MLDQLDEVTRKTEKYTYKFNISYINHKIYNAASEMQRNAKILCPENHTESSFYEATNPIKVIDSKIKFFIVDRIHAALVFPCKLHQFVTMI